MLKLLNIEKNRETIKAQYDPENSGNIGGFEIDIASGKVINSNYSLFDASFPIYFNHGVEALRKILNSGELPKEKIVMWY